TAGSYWLSDSIVPLMLLQLASGAGLAVVTSLIATRLFGGWRAGAAAGLLVALHPGLVVYSATKAHPLAFDALFFSLALLQSYRLVEQTTIRRAVELGVIVGIGTLSRATIVIFLPIAGLWSLMVTPRPSWGRAIRNTVVAGLCAGAIVAPWTIRNSLLHQQFVFLLTTDSDDFWRGNNRFATGHSYFDSDRIVLDMLTPEERQDLLQRPDELAQREWFSTHARAFISANPERFVHLTLMKFFYFWWFAPQTGVLYPPVWRLLYQAYYVGVLIFTVVGVRRIAREGGPPLAKAVVLGAFLLSLSALQSLYYVEGRHRWAVEPMLLALAGGGAACLAERGRHQPSLRSVQ
ncbi:MAG: glycosyltransferase family 39 protein, partial [Acidobacteria bacterium]|nr:glycosyltransferase family 39 protein [Acidobacteriota bacterium]